MNGVTAGGVAFAACIALLPVGGMWLGHASADPTVPPLPTPTESISLGPAPLSPSPTAEPEIGTATQATASPTPSVSVPRHVEGGVE